MVDDIALAALRISRLLHEFVLRRGAAFDLPLLARVATVDFFGVETLSFETEDFEDLADVLFDFDAVRLEDDERLDVERDVEA